MAKKAMAKGTARNLPEDPKNIGDLANIAVELAGEARFALASFKSHSLLLGIYILKFSERPEIQQETDQLNEGRRGRPFKPYTVVIKRLIDETDGKLPGERWLQMCTKAVLDAREAGFELKDIKSVNQLTEELTKRSLVNSLPAPGLDLGDDTGNDDPDVDPDIKILVGATFQAIEKRLTTLLAKAGRKPNYRMLRGHIDKLNNTLGMLGLSIGPIQKG